MEKTITSEHESAIVTVLQMIAFLQPHHLDLALTEMDLNEEAFDEQLQSLKDLVDWKDENNGWDADEENDDSDADDND